MATPTPATLAPDPASALPAAARAGAAVSGVPGEGSAPDVTRGLLLGALAVLIFAATLPMTRMAVGDTLSPQLPPAFVTAGRAAVAGLLSLVYLLVLRPDWPARRHWPALFVSALGTVLGFPLFLSLALRQVDAMHAAVVTGVLPLATAAVAALVLRQRASAGRYKRMSERSVSANASAVASSTSRLRASLSISSV